MLKKVFVLLLSLTFMAQYACSQHTSSLNSSQLSWKVKAADEIKDYKDIFSKRYNDRKWVSAVVPGTVFVSHVEQGLEETPEFGDNIHQVDKSKYNRNFWYRTEFKVPSSFTNDKIWLNFEGVNRKADVYVNGSFVGNLDGFYQRGKFDISSIVNLRSENVLAVLVYCPHEPIPNYTSPTYISSASWDWMPYVPGLLSGITDDVFLSCSGPVQIVDPWIRTQKIDGTTADLSLEVQLNNTTDKDFSGTLTAAINPGNIKISRRVNVKANHFSKINFDSSRDTELTIKNAKLWWPNGYGDQPLYTCDIKFETDNTISDSQTVQFGIRKYSYDKDGNVLHISINGKRIFLKGGNWGMSEYMLRCRGEEYFTKLRLHKEMNYNMIRNWIGSTTDEEFYQACDKYGIMVWDDFWLNSHPNLPRDVFAFNNNAIEKIKRLRNYACIAVWCGDNEGDPLPPLNNWLREDIAVYDGNDRRYHPNSHSDALTGSGIWVNLEPKGYFASPPLGFGGERGWGLRTEIGTAVFTNFESFKKFIPKENWWPQNEMWNKHFFGKSAANAGPDRYYNSIVDRYGQPKDIEDFCKKAQLVNIETNKAMYEGWSDHIWDDASGILIWMSQSAYPSFVWQTYDYYYDLTGAYWGAKSGCEPVHILWNCANNNIRVVNASSNDLTDATATATVYNLDGKEVPGFQYSSLVDVPSNTAATCFTMLFEEKNNLAFKKPTIASSTADDSFAADATDGGVGSRWSSAYSDPQWIYVDLEEVQQINEIHLEWEAAYASSYKLQVSDDADNWKDVYVNENGQGNREKIEIDPVKCRYVRMLGLKRATQWGYSLWELKIFNKDRTIKEVNPLSDVHFIKLELKDKQGDLISENFYWRGNEYLDYKALNTLKEIDLDVNATSKIVNGTQFIKAAVSTPQNAANVAFALRVMLVNSKTGEQILPVFMDDNYFSLIPGESKTVTIEFDPELLNGAKPEIIIKQYASKTNVK